MWGYFSGSWLPALGSWPWSWLPWVLLLLVSLGGGEGAVGHQVAVALAPANQHVRGVTSHLNKCTDLWQDLADLRPPLNPPGPLLP